MKLALIFIITILTSLSLLANKERKISSNILLQDNAAVKTFTQNALKKIKDGSTLEAKIEALKDFYNSLNKESTEIKKLLTSTESEIKALEQDLNLEDNTAGHNKVTSREFVGRQIVELKNTLRKYEEVYYQVKLSYAEFESIFMLFIEKTPGVTCETIEDDLSKSAITSKKKSKAPLINAHEIAQELCTLSQR